jgi:mono/diheme cytochrome c family protein
MVFTRGQGEDFMERRPACFALIAAFAAAGIILAADNAQAQNPGGNPDARTMKNPVASTAASVTAGAATFKKYCAICHGAAGKGDGPLTPKGMTPADLTDEKWDRGSTDGEIFAVIMEGAGPKFEMKGLKGKITDREVWQIVNFLRSLRPKTGTP